MVALYRDKSSGVSLGLLPYYHNTSNRNHAERISMKSIRSQKKAGNIIGDYPSGNAAMIT